MKSELRRVRQVTGERSADGIITFSKEEYDDCQESLSSKKEWPGINVKSGEVLFLIYTWFGFMSSWQKFRMP